MKAKFFPTLEALAVAIAAYRLNDRKIVRETTPGGDKEILPNRQLIKNYFTKQNQIFVNDSGFKEAENIVNYLQQTVIMQSLKGTTDRFLGQLTELLSNQEVSDRDFGILAWAPHLTDQYQKKDRVREISARYEHTSQYIGTPGQKITTDFTLLEKNYIKSMDCYVVYGYDNNNNLIQYWAKNLDKVCEVGQIAGRIKLHREDEYHSNARVTVINYVKIV